MQKRRLLCAIWMLVISFTSIQAQESAFEVFLPYEMDFLNPFGWETSDGCFIVNPGNNMFVKLSPDGKVVGETTYTIESSENVFTRIVSVLDIPNNPTSHLVVAEKSDLTAYPGICNIMHIFKINDDLSYNPEEVIVVDLSEEIMNTGFYFMPRYALEEDGSLLFATNATKLDDTSCLIIVRVSPDGETTIHFDDEFSNFNYLQVCDLKPRGDYYEMVLGYDKNYAPYSSYYEVSHDFDISLVRHFSTGNTANTLLLYDNGADSIFMAGWDGNDINAVTWLNDSAFLLPTEIIGRSHSNTTMRHGAGIWKLDSDFNIMKFVFFDVFDNNLYELPWAVNPLLVNGNEVYFCYTTYTGIVGGPMQTVVSKLDTDLNLIWKRWYGGEQEYHEVLDFRLTSDGGCIASGAGHPEASHYYDPYPYVLKITPDGYCAVQENDEPLLKPYCFFPNPVDDRLHMEFSPDVTPKQVELYDLQGRLVGIQNNGFESVETGQLPSGTYTLRIVMEDGESYSDKVVKQ